MDEITLPYNYAPRDYQMPLWNYLENGGKRAVAIWHRRAGKDLLALSFCVEAAVERVGLYWHLLPTYNQGRKIVWDGMDKQGKPFLSRWPQPLIASVNNTDMRIELINGSIYQVVGTDYVDRLVGANPVGCIFSEYSLQDPRAWDLIRPILKENGGLALFIYTPRGKNHGYALYKMAELNKKDWFCQVLTVNDTGVLSAEDIEDERNSGMSEELVQQEYYCSFESGVLGAYYTQQIILAKRQNRICGVPWHSELPVDTYWDLGMDDSTAIWFGQDVGREVHLIDYVEGHGEGLPFYARELSKRPYLYGNHYAPHDIKVKELGTGRSRKAVAKDLGIEFTTTKKLRYKEDGIEACRNIFSICWFDRTKCARGIDALENYKKEYDERRKVFLDTPLRDWSKHGADAFETLAMNHEFRRGSNILHYPRAQRRVGPADSYAGY